MQQCLNVSFEDNIVGSLNHIFPNREFILDLYHLAERFCLGDSHSDLERRYCELGLSYLRESEVRHIPVWLSELADEF